MPVLAGRRRHVVLLEKLVARQVELGIVAIDFVQVAPSAQHVFETCLMRFQHRNRFGKHAVRLLAEVRREGVVVVGAINVGDVQVLTITDLNDLLGGARFQLGKRLDRDAAIAHRGNGLNLHLKSLACG